MEILGGFRSVLGPCQPTSTPLAALGLARSGYAGKARVRQRDRTSSNEIATVTNAG